MGRQDAISTVAEMNAMARAIPGSRIVEIEDAGHVTPLEAPAAVAAAMEEFLSDLDYDKILECDDSPTFFSTTDDCSN